MYLCYIQLYRGDAGSRCPRARRPGATKHKRRAATCVVICASIVYRSVRYRIDPNTIHKLKQTIRCVCQRARASLATALSAAASDLATAAADGEPRARRRTRVGSSETRAVSSDARSATFGRRGSSSGRRNARARRTYRCATVWVVLPSEKHNFSCVRVVSSSLQRGSFVSSARDDTEALPASTRITERRGDSRCSTVAMSRTRNEFRSFTAWAGGGRRGTWRR